MTLPKRIHGYEIVKELGQGGMAEVFLGRSVGAGGFEKLVAIKRLYPHIARKSENVKMFAHEARVMSRLHHPNIVQVQHFGEEDGTYFMIMEYVDGITLKELLSRARAAGVSLPVSLGAYVMVRVLYGLQAIHTATDERGQHLGLVHRDLSPDNVLISHDGHVKLSDFGIAKSEQQEHQTKTGIIKGKLHYQAPEQLMEQPFDHRADLFCAGSLLFEATTMYKAFACKDLASAIMTICKQDPPRPSSIMPHYPPLLEDIVMYSLTKEPLDRYQSAKEMAQDLQAYLLEEGEFDRDSLAETMASLSSYGHLERGDRSDTRDFPPGRGPRLLTSSFPLRQDDTAQLLRFALGMLAFSFLTGLSLLGWVLWVS